MKSEHFPELTITEQAYCVDTPQIVLNCLVHCMPRSNRVWPFYPKSFFQTASGSVQPRTETAAPRKRRKEQQK